MGKSTLLQNLSERITPKINGHKVAFVPEPVQEWLSTKITENENLLNAMYSGTITRTTFQFTVVQSRFFKFFSALIDPNVEIVVVERSPWDEKFIFADTNLNSVDKNAYNFMFDSMMQFLIHAPPLDIVFLYLKAPRDLLLKRIATRGRSEEDDIDPAYLDALESAHGVLLESAKAGGLNLAKWKPKSIKTSTVDATLSADELCNIAAALCEND